MHTITDRDRYLKVDITDISSLAEIFEAVQAEFNRDDYFRRNDIWEFGNDMLPLQYDDLNQLTSHILEIYPTHATRTKTAIVVPPGLNAAFAKIWAETAGRLPYEVRVFEVLAAAEAWINENNDG